MRSFKEKKTENEQINKQKTFISGQYPIVYIKRLERKSLEGIAGLLVTNNLLSLLKGSVAIRI